MMKRYHDSTIQSSNVSIFFTHPKNSTQMIDAHDCFIYKNFFWSVFCFNINV